MTRRIKENVFALSTTNWDVGCAGPQVTIRGAPDEFTHLANILTERAIIEWLDMQFQDVSLRGNKAVFEFSLDY